MTKEMVVNKLAEKTGLSKRAALNAIDTFFQIVTDSLSKGEKVTFVGFGTFQVGMRKTRKGINPRTKAVITIPGRKFPKFVAGKKLREAVK